MVNTNKLLEKRFSTAFSGAESANKDQIIAIIGRLQREDVTSLEDMKSSFDELSRLMESIDRQAEVEIVRQFDALAKKIGDKLAVRSRR